MAGYFRGQIVGVEVGGNSSTWWGVRVTGRGAFHSAPMAQEVMQEVGANPSQPPPLTQEGKNYKKGPT